MQFLVTKPKPPSRWAKFLAWAKLQLNKIRCWAVGHDWSCNASKGIPPTSDQVQRGFEGFEEYAEMYCTRCPKRVRTIKFDGSI